jgi:hypothetical protein
MATVELHWREVRDDLFPLICIRCGVPVSVRRRRTFRWLPWWQPLVAIPVGVLLVPLALIPIIGRLFYQDILSKLARPREMTMRVPVCPLHESHWLWRSILIWSGLALLLIAALAGVVLGQVVPSWYWRAVAGMLGGWLTLCVVARATMTRAVRITGASLVLANVAAEFADALDEERRAGTPASPEAPERERPRAGAAPKYQVIGFLSDGQRQTVATFDTMSEAHDCARFLRSGGKFQRVEVEAV